MYENVTKMLAVAQSFAPNGTIQAAIAANLRTAQAEGIGEREQVLLLCDTISDGLQYGNWPTPS